MIVARKFPVINMTVSFLAHNNTNQTLQWYLFTEWGVLIMITMGVTMISNRSNNYISPNHPSASPLFSVQSVIQYSFYSWIELCNEISRMRDVMLKYQLDYVSSYIWFVLIINGVLMYRSGWNSNIRLAQTLWNWIFECSLLCCTYANRKGIEQNLPLITW